MTSSPIRRLLGGDSGAALAIFVLVFGVYAATMCRTIYAGDAGDFIIASATGGVPHPTGYPLFVLLGRLFLWIVPFGSPALRMNAMTALFGAAAIAMFYRFAARIVAERFWAAMAALLLAFASTFWGQSLSAEIYSLSCLFLTTLLFLALRWKEQPGNNRLLLLLAFVYGLACTNHLTIVLFLPGFLVFVFATRRTLWREGKLLAGGALAFALPLSLYAYLPLAARTNPPVNWGDPSTLKSFWQHVTAQQYRGLIYFEPRETGWALVHYADLLSREFGPWFLWLAPIGGAALWRRNRALCLLLAWIWIADVAYAANYHIPDIYVYYLPSYIVTVAWIAAGASALHRWVYDRLRLDDARRAHYAPLIAVVALALPMPQSALHLGSVDESHNYLEHDLSANLLRSAPPGALLVTVEQASGLWYRRFVLGQRRDVIPIARGLMISLSLGRAWYYHHIARMYPDIARTYAPDVATYARKFPQEFAKRVRGEDFLLDMLERALRRGKPVLVAFGEVSQDSRYRREQPFSVRLDSRFERVPWGVGERLYLKGRAPSAETIVRVNEALWDGFTLRGLEPQNAVRDPLLFRHYAAVLFRLGQVAEKAHRPDVAANAYGASNALRPGPEVNAAWERSLTAQKSPPTNPGRP